MKLPGYWAMLTGLLEVASVALLYTGQYVRNIAAPPRGHVLLTELVSETVIAARWARDSRCA